MPRKGRKSNKRKRPVATTEGETTTTTTTTTPAVPTKLKRNPKQITATNNDTFSSSDDSESDHNSASDSDSDDDSSSNTSSAQLDATMISNYKTIPVQVLTNEEDKYTLHLYLRVHQSKVGNSNSSNSSSSSSSNSNNDTEQPQASSKTKNTIFVTNFPSCTTKQDLLQLFAELGATNIDSIQFGKLAGRAPKPTKPDGWPVQNIDLKYSLVTFTSSSAVRTVMKWNQGSVDWSMGSGTSVVSKWVQNFQRHQPSLVHAMELADHHMREFMNKKETLRDELDARRGVKDEDGFQLVKKKHTARGSGNKRATNRRSRTRNKKGGAGTELKDFYRFQMRENKRNKLSELRERFNEDRERVEHLRSNKKFKQAAREE